MLMHFVNTEFCNSLDRQGKQLNKKEKLLDTNGKLLDEKEKLLDKEGKLLDKKKGKWLNYLTL